MKYVCGTGQNAFIIESFEGRSIESYAGTPCRPYGEGTGQSGIFKPEGDTGADAEESNFLGKLFGISGGFPDLIDVLKSLIDGLAALLGIDLERAKKALIITFILIVILIIYVISKSKKRK